MRKVRSLGLGLCVLLGSLTITMSAFGWLYWMWPAGSACGGGVSASTHYGGSFDHDWVPVDDGRKAMKTKRTRWGLAGGAALAVASLVATLVPRAVVSESNRASGPRAKPRRPATV